MFKKEAAMKKLLEKKGAWEKVLPPQKVSMTMTQKNKI
jgi:hypothetical protein